MNRTEFYVKVKNPDRYAVARRVVHAVMQGMGEHSKRTRPDSPTYQTEWDETTGILSVKMLAERQNVIDRVRSAIDAVGLGKVFENCELDGAILGNNVVVMHAKHGMVKATFNTMMEGEERTFEMNDGIIRQILPIENELLYRIGDDPNWRIVPNEGILIPANTTFSLKSAVKCRFVCFHINEPVAQEDAYIG